MVQKIEISTSVAMLVSVFGEPQHTDSDANTHEWNIEFSDGAKATIRNLSKEKSTGRITDWEIISDSQSALDQCRAKLEEGESYYEGALHPELFIKPHK